MDLTKTVTTILGIQISWNSILNLLFLIASTVTLIVAIILQIVQSIKAGNKTDK